MSTTPRNYSFFFKNFVGASIIIVGLLGAMALFGEWGFIISALVLIGVAVSKLIKR